MSAATPCVPCCSTPQSVNIPGLEGLPGTNGLNGQSAFTITLGDILIPAVVGNNVVAPVLVGSTNWMVVGQILIIGQGPGAALVNPGPATFQVVAITNPTTLTLKYLGYPGDAGVGLLISTGAYVSPAGVQSSTVANPLPVANGGTGQTTAASAARALTSRFRMIGSIIGANFNSTADQAIAGLPSLWIPRRIVVTNASADLSAATIPLGGFYTGAAKTGTAIVAAGQSYSPLSTSAKWMDLTLAAAVLSGTDAMTVTTIYFSLSTAHGGAATADIYVFADDLV